MKAQNEYKRFLQIRKILIKSIPLFKRQFEMDIKNQSPLEYTERKEAEEYINQLDILLNERNKS